MLKRLLVVGFTIILSAGCGTESTLEQASVSSDVTDGGMQETQDDLHLIPDEITLQTGATTQFLAAGAEDAAISWAVSESDGGEITPLGRYTAPAHEGTFHVIASADGYQDASAAVHVTGDGYEQPLPGVDISPAYATVFTGETQVFSLQAVDYSIESAHWEVAEGVMGGTVTDGLYTAPATAGVYHVMADINEGEDTISSTVIVQEQAACDASNCPPGTVPTDDAYNGCAYDGSNRGHLVLNLVEVHGKNIEGVVVQEVDEDHRPTGVCAVALEGGAALEIEADRTFGIRISRSDFPDNYRFGFNVSGILSTVQRIISTDTMESYATDIEGDYPPEAGYALGTVYKADGSSVDYDAPMTLTAYPPMDKILYFSNLGDPMEGNMNRHNGMFLLYGFEPATYDLAFFVSDEPKTIVAPSVPVLPQSVTWARLRCSDFD